MKNIIILFLFMVWSGSLLKAQLVGGGERRTENNPENTATEVKKFKNTGYIKIGLSLPTGIYGQQPTPNGYIEDNYNSLDGMGAKPGFTADLGRMFYFKSLPLDEKYHVGIDWTYITLSENQIDWSNLGGRWADGSVSYTPFVFLGTKIGPCFTYTPAHKFSIDAFLKANILFSVAGSVSYYGDAASFDYTGLVNKPVKGSLGFNVRYYGLVVGIEYAFGAMQYNMENSDASRYFTPDIKTNNFQLTLGFCW